MNKIAALDTYSQQELDRAREFSPAFARYFDLLSRPPRDQKSSLRLERHRTWCAAVLATVNNKASSQEICRAWSDAADQLIARAWREAGGDDKDLIILALGKLGSQELNLSSDVDLVFVRRDQKVIDQKILHDFTALLSELTEFAYCLRVDLNLRPGGSSGSPITSQTEFEYHYGYHGEMWERLSYVRARYIFGDKNLAQEILKFANHFSYRKHIDLTLVDDLSQLRGKIHHEVSLKNQFNLKLSPGAIRDLELFVHSLQLIHGGKNKALQTQSTSFAIERLAQMKFIAKDDAKFLFESYWYFRNVENHLQAQNDQHTYVMTKDLADFKLDDIKALAARADKFVSELLKRNHENDLPTELELQQEWLRQNGFSETSIKGTWPEIVSASAQSLKSERDESSRLQFLKSFVEHLSRINHNKDLALAFLADFIRATRAKASLYSLLNREQRLTEEIAWLFSCSSYLANILTMRPELIDSLFFNAQGELPEADDELLEMLVERRLLVEILSAQKFLKGRDLHLLATELSETADNISRILLDRLGATDINIICLGKWGGRELGFRSDLDFIFMTETDPSPVQQKICRKFMSWLNQPTRGGIIYTLDMRLRPSGHAGPLIVSKAQIENFLSSNAEAWERQAYLRARPLNKTTFNPAQTACARGLSANEEIALAEIRLKLLVSGEDLDLKFQIGGLVDIEFSAQIALLKLREFALDSSTQGMIQYLMEKDTSWKELGHILQTNYNFLRSTEQMYQLTNSQAQTKLRKSSEAFSLLAANLNLQAQDLYAKLQSTFSENSQILEQLCVRLEKQSKGES